MSADGGAIGALICGYPSEERAQKIMVFVGFADDSASDSGGRRMFLAAYIHHAENWARFADLWRYELDRDSLEYFKMVEAKALRGQFRGWKPERRDAKVLAFAQLIQKHRPWFVSCSISRTEYAELLSPTAPENLKDPYAACFWGVIGAANRFMLEGKINPALPINFVFDEQGGLGHDAALFFAWHKADSPPNERELMGAVPVFRDDKQMVALHAADMFAWHLRRDHEEGGMEDRTIFDMLTEYGGVVHLPRDVLQSLARRMKDVPGVGSIQTKKQWQQTRRGIRSLVEAGALPPSTNIWWMRYINIMVGVERVRYRFRRALKRWRSRG